MGLADNQTIEIVEYSFDETVDLNQIDTIEVKISDISEILWADILKNADESGSSEFLMRTLDDEHEWKLTIPLEEGQYADYLFDVQQTYDINGMRFHINSIELTPMGISFCYELLDENGENLYIVSGGYLNNYTEDMKLIMRDGKKIKFEGLYDGGQMYQMKSDGSMEYEHLHFSVPIDVEQVVGVEVDGEIIELKK